LNAGNIANASNYTLQYSGTMKAWLHGGAGGLFHGVPLDLIKEVSNRTGIGAFIPMPVEYTQASYQALGAYAATNMPGIPIITESGNELWNNVSGVYGRAAGMGAAMGMGNPLAGLFRSGVDSFQSLRTAQNLPSFTTGYTGAGGSASLVHPTIQNWALAALTNPPDGNMVKSIWEGGSTTQAGTFTGTFGTTNGLNTVTVSGLVGNWRIYPAQALTGSCVSAGTHIVRNDGLASQFAGNGVYVIDVAQSGTCTVTATNPAYNLSSGPGGAAASTVYNTAPTRAIDLVDGVGYAVYYFGALIRQGAGQSFTAVAQSIYETPVNLFQASADYAQGVATSNSTLINNALNIVATDLVAGTKNGSPGTDIANKFIGSGAYSGAGNGVAPSFEALIAVYDGARPSGKANLSVYQYEGGEQQTLCSGNPCGSGTTVGDAGTVASQFTTNGWTTLDATYGYPGFGAGSTVTATNMVNMFLGFVRSTQFYHTQLCLMQQIGAVHATRPVFAPAQYGINGAGSLNSPGAALWGIYTGVGISTPKQGNYTALKDYSNGVTATCP
jgi:hypothetical protein